MANEFIARKGLVVLENGIKVTGSSNIVGNLTASGDIVATNFRGNGQFLTNVAATSVDYANVTNKPTLVSSSVQINTGSFSGSFKGDGSALTGIATNLRISGSTGNDTLSLLSEDLTFAGTNGATIAVTNNTVTISIPTGTVSASGQIDHNSTSNYDPNRHIDHTAVSITAGSGLSGGGTIAATRTLTLDTSSVHFLDGVKKELNTEGVVSSSNQVSYTQLQNIPSGIVSGSVQVTALLPTGTVSSSGQIDVRNTTGIGTIATTGSNTLTGIQTISNTTDSTAFNTGALIVQGGVGIAKNVNISGSLNVTGLLTAASMSVTYVTSSQLNVTDNKITVQTNDITRFGGLSVYDSGSTNATASIYWDSLNHQFIYENLGGSSYNSAIIIAGPTNTGALGSEPGLTVNRVPVAVAGDHIDSRLASSSIRVDFPSRFTHIEAGLHVTGSITSSVGFSGDGSNLTGVVSTLSVTGSQGGQGAVNLKTQGLTVTGTNGVAASVSGQTLTISGSNATTSAKGVASFNSTNFTVTGGEVTSNNITINGNTVTLGGTRNITLAQITTQGATTTDQVTLNGGAIIHGVLYTSASAASIVGPVTNQVIATVATGSYDSAQFDYVLKDGTNYRAGTVMAVWNSTTGFEFTDTSTADIGNTGQAVLSVDTNAANVRLKLTLTSGTWTAKTAIRML